MNCDKHDVIACMIKHYGDDKEFFMGFTLKDIKNIWKYLKCKDMTLNELIGKEVVEDEIYISEHGTVYRKDIDYVEGYKKWEAKNRRI